MAPRTNTLVSLDHAAERLAIVLGALRDIGVSTPRPAPRASLAFVPRQIREV
jgi:hypothetical protein